LIVDVLFNFVSYVSRLRSAGIDNTRTHIYPVFANILLDVIPDLSAVRRNKFSAVAGSDSSPIRRLYFYYCHKVSNFIHEKIYTTAANMGSFFRINPKNNSVLFVYSAFRRSFPIRLNAFMEVLPLSKDLWFQHCLSQITLPTSDYNPNPRTTRPPFPERRRVIPVFEGGFEVFDDFLGKNVKVGEIVGVVEACLGVGEKPACSDFSPPVAFLLCKL